MKTILVPVDFSETSKNALLYAADMAAEISAEVVIFHAHDLTMDEAIPAFPPSEEIESDAMIVLHNLADLIKEKHGNRVKTSVNFSYGLPVDEIVNTAEAIHADLIVAGMPDHGFISERILGSIAANLMLKASCPVLTVHRDKHFNGIKNIALAADYQPMPAATIKPIEQLVEIFSAHLFILNVHRKNSSTNPGEQISAGLNLDYELRNLPHSFHDLENKSVIDGIEHFVTENQIDLVVILPRKHDWFTNLTSEPMSKKAAFNLSVPVMAIHH